MRLRYDIPVEKQRWIVGNRVAQDTESLADCNVTVDDALIFCYVASFDLVQSLNIMEYGRCNTLCNLAY